jgi:hypothetical protein
MRIKMIDNNIKEIANKICAAATSGDNSSADIVTACGMAYVSICYAFKDKNVGHDELRTLMITIIDDIALSLREIMESKKND